MFVSNASTLILLAKISIWRIFIENSPTITIPEEVKKELLAKTSFDALLIDKAIQEEKIIVEKACGASFKNKIIEQFHLDIGEAAAFASFDRVKHKAILTDDGELIKLCKLENTPFICAMAIVVRLFEKKLLPKQETLQKLERLVGIGRYRQNIYEHYKEEVG